MVGHNVKKLLCRSGGLSSQLMYQGFVGGPQDKSADNIGVLEVGQLVASSRKAPDVVPQGRVRFLPIIVKIPRVS